jgi:hypothetical protein
MSANTTSACLLLAILFFGSIESGKTADNLISDPDFKQPKQWILGDGYRIEPFGGMDGKTVLVVERTNPDSYVLGHTVVKLIPDRTYEIGVYVKGENIHNGEANATLAAEFFDSNGKFIDGGAYPQGLGGTFGWTLVHEKMYVPPGVVSCNLLLYLRPGTLGKAWFSQPYIRPVAGNFEAYLLCPAMPTLIEVGKRSLIFGIIPPEQVRSYQCRVALWKDGKEITIVQQPVRKNRVECQLEIPAGDIEFRLTLLENKSSVGEVKISARGIAGIENIPVRVDDRGRTWVNGEKFFPIGLYMNQHDSRIPGRDLKTDLKIIAASPFNCVMPYDGLSWGNDSTQKPGVAAVRKMFDYCKSQSLKVIFSVKDIRSEKFRYDGAQGETAVIEHVIDSLRSHPALLAWYINDEDPAKFRPEFIARNAFINRLDPTHPTWAVNAECNHRTVYYGGSATIYSLDPYPINDAYSALGESTQMKVA